MHVLDRLSDEAKKEFWASLALRCSEGARPRLLAKILRHYGSAYQAYQKLTAQEALVTYDDFAKKIPASFRTALKNEGWRKPAMQEWQDAQKTDCEVILWTDYRYPLALKQLIDAPLFFYAKGDVGLLSYPTLAIVGARKASSHGKQKAGEIAGELASLGLAIVSGMALGIDQSAHEGALAVQGKTIAVLGTGINIVYPKEHSALYQKIAEKGLLISEFSPFTKPLAENFPIRNRLITGISEGVLIVEAALKSGSLITARLALEQNKNVYVCRPLGENHSLGGQKLLEEGALCVDDAYTLIADLVPHLSVQYENLCKKKQLENTLIQNEDKSAARFEPKKKLAAHDSTVQTPKGEEKKIIRQTQAQKTDNGFAPQAKKTYPAYSILQRPKIDEELLPLSLDFGEMAQSILNKKNPHKKIFQTYKKEARKAQTQKNLQRQKEQGSEKILHIQKEIVSDDPLIQLLVAHENLTADEMLQHLQAQGKAMDMASLSSDLLMLEVEGKIVKEAGACYRVCHE